MGAVHAREGAHRERERIASGTRAREIVTVNLTGGGRARVRGGAITTGGLWAWTSATQFVCTTVMPL